MELALIYMSVLALVYAPHSIRIRFILVDELYYAIKNFNSHYAIIPSWGERNKFIGNVGFVRSLLFASFADKFHQTKPFSHSLWSGMQDLFSKGFFFRFVVIVVAVVASVIVVVGVRCFHKNRK